MNIHLSIKRWRDRTNGNSYFAARIYKDGAEIARLPFQYGYGSQPEWEAVAELRRLGIVPPGPRGGLTQALHEMGVALTIGDHVRCAKREVEAHGNAAS